MSKDTALYLHLQRLSTEDGPGIRTTVFLKGCMLHCSWCHNPESIALRPQVHWLERKCIDCLTCVEACPNGYITMTARGVEFNRDGCEGCDTCAEACPANAIELLGTRISVDELFDEVIKDQIYFTKSGGGVTVSGGEPVMQPNFVAAFMARLQAAGVHTALDTCGMYATNKLDIILPHADMVLYDLKEMDTDKHHTFTGQDNQRILENLLYIHNYITIHKPEMSLWVRTPLIPGATATQENIQAIGAFLAENLTGRVERWDLLAFNNLCRDKYQRLGLSWQFAETPLLTETELQQFDIWARTSGVDPEIVVLSGATKVTEPVLAENE